MAMAQHLSDESQALIKQKYVEARRGLEWQLWRITYGASAMWPPDKVNAAAITQMNALAHELAALAYGLPEPLIEQETDA